MLNFLTKGITKIFGTKSERDIKDVMPLVEAVKAAYPALQSLSDDQLRDKSQQLRLKIATDLAEIDGRIAALKQRAAAPENSVAEKEALFDQLEALQKQRDKELEVVLLNILPEAFAVVKETARRYKDNGQLVVQATQHDIDLAAVRPHIRIENGQAIWPNRWMAAGNEIVWDMLHYDVQLIGGIVLHTGKISEMATGEGKTLVATLPAFLNALAGNGVHIVTVNDYLARRDSQWMGPLYEFHGMRCDCIDLHEPNSEARRRAYLADITYGTNNEFGFDYLRDNMVREPEELVQRKLHYAMVDEVDSVLIDDARTPLIISGPVGRSDQQIYMALKPRVQRLYEAQRALTTGLLSEARKKIAEGNEKEGGLALFRAYRALPKNKPLIKFLSEQGARAILQKTENQYLQDNSRLMPEADRELFFTIDEKNNSVELTGKGLAFITANGEDSNFFVLPVLSTALDAIEKDKSLSEDEQLVRKEAVIQEYTDKAERLHVIHQLLKAYTLFEKEVEYIIMEGKVKIVDEQTGRVLEGRRYSDGLHQALEAKENVAIEDATQTYATVTLQNYFRMYHKLAGMTGTAETEAGEFDKIYKLDVVVIPTNRPITRADNQDKVYKTTREKYNAVADEIQTLTKAGRPVLVGTTSVENSELLSRMLRLRGINHNVLNAKYHQKEAEIVAEAGKPGTVTIATNMAGRGTDIKLTPESRAAGGLAIIGTERHESRRVDRQLRGRSGRQGDPGTSQFFVSLEDSLMRLFGSDRIIKIMDRLGLEEGEVIQHSMVTNSIERAQRKVEENNFSIRKRLLEYDDVMNSQRNVIYRRRRSALFGERLELEIVNMIGEASQSIVDATKPANDFEDFRLRSQHTFGTYAHGISKDDFLRKKAEELTQQLVREMYAHYQQRRNELASHTAPVFAQMLEQSQGQVMNVITPLTDGRRHLQVAVGLEDAVRTNGHALMKVVEKVSVLHFIDTVWKEHLREMDELRQSVQNASLEQKDPLLVYKAEAFNMFRQLITRLNDEVLTFLFKCGIPVETEAPQAYYDDEQPMENPMEVEHTVVNREPEPDPVGEMPQPQQVRRQPIRNEPPLPNRNDRVSVRYANGEIKRDVKFKSVEEDLMNNRCVLID